jgi:hypothetical protein
MPGMITVRYCSSALFPKARAIIVDKTLHV